MAKGLDNFKTQASKGLFPYFNVADRIWYERFIEQLQKMIDKEADL